MRYGEANLLLYYLPLHAILIAWTARTALALYREHLKDSLLRFHLLELLAAIVALAPTHVLLARTLECSSFGGESEGQMLLLLTIQVGTGQLCGALVGRMHNTAPRKSGPMGGWEGAGWVALFSAAGALLPPFGWAVAGLGWFLLVVCLPLLLPAAAIYVVYLLLRQR